MAAMSRLSMLELNDDCLMLIFDHLLLEDQLSIASASERFHAVLSTIWQKKYRELNIDETIMSRDNSEIHIFLGSICQTVERIILRCFDKFNVIKTYTFQNLKAVFITSCFIYDIEDKHMLEMTKMFPNTRSLTLERAGRVGKHMENWRYLEHLNFEFGCEVLFQDFEKLLEQLQLKSVVCLCRFEGDVKWKSSLAFEKFCNLERITVWERELGLLTNISLFTKIKELKIQFIALSPNFPTWDVIKQIAEHKRNDLLELQVNDLFRLDLFLGRTCDNLQKITIYLGDSTNLNKIFELAPNLREIFLFECYNLREEDIVLWLNYPKIERVCIQMCRSQFKVLRVKVKDIIKRRTRICFCRNFFEDLYPSYDSSSSNREPIALEIDGESTLLKISTDIVLDYDFKYVFKFR